ncbi:hypothetical protein EV426DRAFT_581123 [Tirmania nivea]|nr:hypothetical protein EV426DRAFT_581123 [Tirmania nivea]
MTESYERTDTYSDSSQPFDFHAEPEPEPPALANGSNGVKSSIPNGLSKNSSESSDKSPEEERTWTSLTLPGAILNSTVYIIGKTIELLAPYWPSSEQRHKAQSLAQAHPVLTSFLAIQVMFLLVPIVGFAAFVVALAMVMVGGAVLFVVGVGLGVGVVVFIPGVLVAAGWAAVVWSLAYLGFRAARVALGMYKSSSYYRALSQENDQESKKLNGASREQLEKPKKGNGEGWAYRQGGYLNAEEDKKGPTSANSLASPTVTKEYVKVLTEGDRDEDKVGRDIMRSLG